MQNTLNQRSIDTGRSVNYQNATAYELYCIDQHRQNYGHATYHWPTVPEDLIDAAGFKTDYNQVRLNRCMQKDRVHTNLIGEYGLDGIAVETVVDASGNIVVKYHGIQSKLYDENHRLCARSLGTFYQVMFMRFSPGIVWTGSVGYLYHTCKMECNVRDDILNTNGKIMAIHTVNPFNAHNAKLDEIPATNPRDPLPTVTPWANESQYVLRDYQENAIAALMTEWQGTRLLTMACGLGKSTIYNTYVRREAFSVVFIVSPLQMHAAQSLERIKSFVPGYSTLLLDSDGSLSIDELLLFLEMNENGKVGSGCVVSTTYASAVNLLSQLFVSEEDNNCRFNLSYSLVIVDEAHNMINNAPLVDLIEKFPKVLLVTATPPATMAKVLGCPTIFEYSMSEAIRNKYICDYQVYLPLINVNEDGKNVSVCIPEELRYLIGIESVEYSGNCDMLRKILFLITGMLRTGSRKCIVYLGSIEQCRLFTTMLEVVMVRYHGLPVWTGTITNVQNRSVREKTLREFQNNHMSGDGGISPMCILASVRILNEGIDIVRCDSVFLATVSDSTSEICTVQRICRANRLDSQNPNKVASCFLWCDDLDNVVRLLQQLKSADVAFGSKIRSMGGNYEVNREKVREIEIMETQRLADFVRIQCVTQEEMWTTYKERLFVYVDRDGRLPKASDMFGEWAVGRWYHHQKKDKIPERLTALSFHPLIQADLDRYLSRDKQVIMGTWDELCDRFLVYVSETGRLPTRKDKMDDGWAGGVWYSKQKMDKIPERLAALMFHPLVKEDLERHLNQDQRVKYGTHEELCARFLVIATDLGRIPTRKEKFDGWAAGAWYVNQKNRHVDQLALLRTHPLVRADLDRCMNQEKQVHIHNWDELHARFLGFVAVHGRLPGSKELYNGWAIGKWYTHQKEENKLIRITALRTHPLVRDDLDRYMSKEKRVAIGTQDELCARFILYVTENERIPIQKEKVNGWALGAWYNGQKTKKIPARLAALRVHPLINVDLARFLGQEKQVVVGTWDELHQRFNSWVTREQRVPKVKEKDEDWAMGRWYANQKTCKTPERLDILRGHPLVRADLDRYLAKCENKQNALTIVD